MTRVPDWPERLHDFLAERRARRFRYGAQDCARLAADWVREATGADPMAGMTYSSAQEARALIEQEGGLMAALDRRFAPIAPGLAQRGDLALARSGRRDLIAIVEYDALVAPGRRGLVRLPRAAAHSAWRV